MYFWFNKRGSETTRPSSEKVHANWILWALDAEKELNYLILFNLSQLLKHLVSFIRKFTEGNLLLFLEAFIVLFLFGRVGADRGDVSELHWRLPCLLLKLLIGRFTTLPAKHFAIDNMPINNAIENLISLDSSDNVQHFNSLWFNSRQTTQFNCPLTTEKNCGHRDFIYTRTCHKVSVLDDKWHPRTELEWSHLISSQTK